jgi:predicted enzyme related to lactoylglutathione lyase
MPALPVSANLTFFYYRDLPTAMNFYEGVLGLDLVIDQGFCKIYKITPHSFVGLVDGVSGTHKPHEIKPVILSFVAPDAATVDAWHTHLVAHGATIFRPLGTSEKIGVHGFMALDPEGYTLEFEAFVRPSDAQVIGIP